MASSEHFQGFASRSHARWSDFELLKFKPKTWSEDDVDIEIEYCGVCGSDVHMITGGWAIPEYPLVVGHEVVGIAKRVGNRVSDIKVGDVVGCGAQIGSCGECSNCKDGHENYCISGFVDTYNCNWPDGTRTHGGYSDFIRVNSHFAFKIPDALPAEEAAPMLCGGLTVYAPLTQNGCGPSKKVGVVGIGGLGHYALQFAAALGAEVWAISHSPRKKDDALKMGAHHFVETSKKGWEISLEQTFDLIISTTDCDDGFPLKEYLSTLRPLGRFITIKGSFNNVNFGSVGMPNSPLPTIRATDFLANGCTMGATHIGNRREALEMLELAAKNKVRSWIQTEPLSAAGCKKVVEAVKNGQVRYRWVLDAKGAFTPRSNGTLSNGLH